MKGHSWNRREFSVTPNGYFTVLRPSGWFSTVRLPGGFRYRLGLSDETEYPIAAPQLESTSMPQQKVLDHSDIQAPAILSQSMIPSTPNYRLLRTVLIILAATVITFIILSWLLSYTQPYPANC